MAHREPFPKEPPRFEMITRIAIYTIMTVFIFSGAALSQSEGLKTEIIDVNRSDPETLAGIVGHLKSSDGKIMVDSRTNKIIIVKYTLDKCRF